MISIEQIYCLEEKLCEEKSKNNILEQDTSILSEKINEEKASYCQNLKKFREEIKRLKTCQQNNFNENNEGNLKELEDTRDKLR